MLKQDFTVRSLLQVTTLNEIIKFELGRNKKEYERELEKYSEKISDVDFELKNIKYTVINEKRVYYAACPEDHYALKKISRDLKRLYRIKTQNRDDISEQVLRILETSSDFGLIRIDIKSFYESISYKQVLEKLKNDKLLSSKSIKILSGLLELPTTGLPRGLSISPVLSEIFMRNIDSLIKEIPGIYYYSRYVDDIFIFSTKEYNSIYSKIIDCLRKEKLELNKKTYVANISRVNSERAGKNSFDYLGYKYTLSSRTYNNKRVVNVSLSDDKVRKIKTRIIHSLLDRSLGESPDYIKSKLLKKRINILSGNYPISSSNGRNGTLKGGIFYSNRLVNKSGIFEEFNDFLKRAVYTKRNNFFGNAMKKIPIQEKNEICSICFKDGFIKKKHIEVSDQEMKVIKSCWEHKNHKKRQ